MISLIVSCISLSFVLSIGIALVADSVGRIGGRSLEFFARVGGVLASTQAALELSGPVPNRDLAWQVFVREDDLSPLQDRLVQDVEDSAIGGLRQQPLVNAQ